jgi:hypothetical protein
MRNKYGLSRDIPGEVKRAVRQRCGFGCVICAGAIVDYEHFSPEFSKATRHDPEGITLLCPACHAKKTRNMISQRRVREANQDPAARKVRYAFSDVEASEGRPFIKLAGMTLRNCNVPLEVRGYPLFQVEGPEEVNGPYRLTASFFNRQGQPSLFVRQNEWKVFSDSWDVEVTGPSVTVRMQPGEIALRLMFVPGEGLIVERLDMYCAGFHLVGNREELHVRSPDGGGMSFTRCLADNCNVGLSLG